MWHRTIDCLGVAVDISTELAALEQALTAVFRTYAETRQSPQLRYVLEVTDWPRIVRDGNVVGRHDVVEDLVPALEIELYAQVIARAPGLVLHAGAIVGTAGTAIVFAGRSGAGKSTLLRGLLAHGFRFLTEECVALTTGGACVGLARALHIDDDTIAVPSSFHADDYLLRQGDHYRRGRLFHPPEAMIWRQPARAVAVVAIDHAADASGELEPLTGGAALAALWPTVFRPDAAAIADAPAILDGLARYRLLTRTPQQALDRMLTLAQELGVER